jgi:hypothetical protein
MEEKVTFTRQLAERKRKQKMPDEADALDKEANAVDGEVTKVRDLIVCGIGNQRSIAAAG